MNRRRFFQAIGSAVLGTAIALNLPETILPRLVAERARITYRILSEAYMNCSRGAKEPSMIVLNETDFQDVYEILGPLPFAHEDGGIRFRGAKIIINRMFNQPQGEIQVIGGYDVYSCGSRFYF